MKTLSALLALLLLACDAEVDLDGSDSPTGPGPAVVVTADTACSGTDIAGQALITDRSLPASAIDRVTGQLLDDEQSVVCQWTIDRNGNAFSSATCNGLSAGKYSFEGQVIVNTGQGSTSTRGSCKLT